jgi:ATPase associated with various cellular activities AAA_5
MKLNLSSLSFNLNIKSGGATPAWGTELGQDSQYKFSAGLEEFLTAMLYKSVPDVKAVFCPLGKGGNQAADYDFIVASIFDKIFVNGERVEGAKILLLIIRKNNGDNHVGRMTLKYNPKMTYNKEEINKKGYELIAKKLGVDAEKGAWFVDEIYTKNQDELHLIAYAGGNSPINLEDLKKRRNFYLSKIENEYPKNIKYENSVSDKEKDLPLQQIFYGAPGTGKSCGVKRALVGNNVPNENIFRTTFHPDSDYSTFVGAYKPTMEVVPHYESSTGAQIEEKRIAYNFIPQAFLNAYVRAYQTDENVYLVIEEINRGNCAQIFGDLFQLLDRGDDGKSDYSIKADTDIRAYLEEVLGDDNEGIKGGNLCLPANLYILATMNTSDQSLFPIDSAFKRRWEWEYVPIRNEEKGWVIAADGQEYDWWQFLNAVNEKIGSITDSEDKKLGYFFVKPADGHTITAKTFVGKVLFYLWNDVFKDYGFSDDEFQTEDGKEMKYPMFYETEGGKDVNERLIARFLSNLKLKTVDAADVTAEEITAEEDEA